MKRSCKEYISASVLSLSAFSPIESYVTPTAWVVEGEGEEEKEEEEEEEED